MLGLGEQLQSLRGRLRLVCVGNPHGGDDAFGVRLGEKLAGQGAAEVVIAGTEPEICLARGAARGCDHLIFVDAVDFGAAPGSVVFLDCQKMNSRLPQVSTHRLSLGLLAKWIESDGVARAWLLGVQPESLQPGNELSPSVRATMAMLQGLLMRRFQAGASVC